LGMPYFAHQLRSINPYLGSLERLRSALISMCDEFLAKEPEPGATAE